MRTNYKIVDTVAGLEKAVRILEKGKAVAVDMEADSMYHFQVKVCLVQMATEKSTIVVDPLQVKNLSPLKPIFSNPDIKKIFHGADYDVRSLFRDFTIEINNLFDTELACRFLGIKETGLEAVIEKYLNITLDKKFQKKDWSKRPLPQEMIDYAAGDVIYLLSLAQVCEKELEKKCRLAWVLEECDILSKVRPVLSDEEPLFLRFKGAGRLKPKSLAVLEALLPFRKGIAEKKDKPLFKIIGNESIMKIATAKPATLRRLKGIKALSGKQINMYGNDLIEVVAGALKIPESNLPVYPKKKTQRLPYKVPERIKALKSWRASKVRALKIDPGIICNNALITSIAIQNPVDRRAMGRIKVMKNWQKKEFGQEIITLLRSLK
ncbi:MAG: HRDC domain-containing protein [Thermodesulfobacteriota bacterium]|nr:HRDC domain-containing protein [Thermodesulfobacteriota bacterium]